MDIQNQNKNIPSLQSNASNLDPTMNIDSDWNVENIFADTVSTVELSEDPNSIYHYFVASPMYAGFGNLNSPERMNFLQSFSQMSPGLKGYLVSSDTVELIFSLGKDYNFEDSQISRMGILIRELLIGQVFIKDFPATLSSRLGIDDIKSAEIVNRIVSKSFGPILEDVKRIQRSKFSDKIMQLQKESRPEGLNPKPQIPESAKNMPLNQPTARPIPSPQTQAPPPRPAQPPPQNQPMPPLQGGSVRPVQPLNPAPPQSPPAPSTFKPVAPPSPAIQTPPPPQNQPVKPLDPTTSTPLSTGQSKPAFKIPDIGQSFSMMEKTPAKNEPNAQKASPAIKSLEEELEKVSSVVDLRNKTEK